MKLEEKINKELMEFFKQDYLTSSHFTVPCEQYEYDEMDEDKISNIIIDWLFRENDGMITLYVDRDLLRHERNRYSYQATQEMEERLREYWMDRF